MTTKDHGPSAADDARAAVAWMLDACEDRAHVDNLDGIGDNLEMLARQSAGPIVAPALAVLSGLASEDWEPVRPEPAGLWHDLRPSEALELRELVDEAVAAAVADCRAAITDRLAMAAAMFADRHPDAPRGDWRAVVAQGVAA